MPVFPVQVGVKRLNDGGADVAKEQVAKQTLPVNRPLNSGFIRGLATAHDCDCLWGGHSLWSGATCGFTTRNAAARDCGRRMVTPGFPVRRLIACVPSSRPQVVTGFAVMLP